MSISLIIESVAVSQNTTPQPAARLTTRALGTFRGGLEVLGPSPKADAKVI